MAAHDVRFQQHSRRQPCGDARGDRRARVADRASPHTAAHAEPLRHPPGLDARRHVAAIARSASAATSGRRPPTTITREMPVHPSPRRRRSRTSRLKLDLARPPLDRRTPASSGCAPTSPKPERDSTAQPSHPHRRRTRCRTPRRMHRSRILASTPTTTYSSERLDERHADRGRRERVHTAPHFFSALGARSLQAQRHVYRRCPADSRQARSGRGERHHSSPYPR